MAKKEYVSFNQPIDNAVAEQGKLKEEGYVVVDSYGNDFDCGNILEYANGEDSLEVMERHLAHVKRCESQREWRQKNIFNE